MNRHESVVLEVGDGREVEIIPGVPLQGADRELARLAVAQLYLDGGTVRSIASQIGRSFGSVHALLKEAGVLVGQGGKVGTP